MARKVHKFVSGVTFTPTGESAVAFPGILEVSWSEKATLKKSQTGASTRADVCICLGIDDTITFTTEDIETLDLTNIVAGKDGAFAWSNVAASSVATAKTYTASNCMIESHDYTAKAGDGPQSYKVSIVATSTDGSTAPIAIT